jgi:mRNA interferase MazF
MNSNLYQRGSIWWVNLSKLYESSVQSGFRPVVIVSSSAGCLSSDIVTVCPCTTKIKNLSVNISIKPFDRGQPTQVLTNQIRTIPKVWLSSHIGNLDKEDMAKVDEGLMASLGLIKPTIPKLDDSEVVDESHGQEKVVLEELILQAKKLVIEINKTISKVEYNGEDGCSGRKYIRRSRQEVDSFIKEWEDPSNNRNEVYKLFGFNSYKAAYNFWVNHRGR